MTTLDIEIAIMNFIGVRQNVIVNGIHWGLNVGNKMKEKINILSLFDGMSTLQLAMKNQGVPVGKYYASEIKPYAIKLTNHHFPDTIQLGDINNWREWDIDWKSIDFIGSGSPCQDLSIAGKRKGLSGERSSLFFVFVDILNHIRKFNPDVKFLQENVASAPKKDVGIMSRALGVYPMRINSSLVTAQLRDRYYWSNIKTKKNLFDLVTYIPMPKDKNILLKDIIESGYVDRKKSIAILERYGKANSFSEYGTEKSNKYLKKRADKQFITVVKEATKKGYVEVKPLQPVDLAYPKSKTRRGRLMIDKSNALLCKNEFYLNTGYDLRLFTQIELERLQGFPDGFTSILSYNEASSVLGDGWTLPVIEEFIKEYKRTLHTVSCA